jgi:cell division protein FtsQ
MYFFKSEWSWRLKLIILAAILIFIIFVWFIYFSSYFSITKIEINGNIKIPSNDIEKLVWQQSNNRRFFIGLQKNINIFNKDKLLNTLNEQYYFEKLSIKKDLPNTIIINLEEKSYSLIWYEADNYYYIDSNGSIISEADPLEIKQKSYPLIDNRGEKKVSGNAIEVNSNNLNYVTQLFKKFKNNHKNFKVDRFILDNELNTVKIALLDGPEIYFNIQEDISNQIAKLLVIVNEKLKDNFANKTYIDLRYGDRVYYR